MTAANDVADEAIVWIGLGANMGDRRAHLERAVAELNALPGVRVLAVSSWRESEPVGAPPPGPPPGPYLNGAVRLATRLPPAALLPLLKELERAHGRDLGAPRNAPRPLDLDVLLWGEHGEVRVDTSELRVPHPRLFEREFALAPLRELGWDPDSVERPPALATCTTAGEFAALLGTWSRGGCVIGLVPTMGALHEGHASLLRAARRECDRVAATIFVNPLQFAPHEDLARYPRPLAADLELLRREGADAVFLPAPETMYPDGFCSRVAVGREAEGMEGAVRPGHFAGVATVVAKLFAIARPTFAYFGRKDAQQLAVVRRLCLDLGFPLGIRECPTVREPDGLAMSSRNVYLEPADRAAAPVLYRALCAARAAHAAGERERERLLQAAREVVSAEPRVRVDYLELRAEGDLAPLPPGPVHTGRMLIAARLGAPPRETRLIDNLSLVDPLDALLPPSP